MKRFFMIALLAVASLSAWCKDFNTDKLKLLNEIMTFLRVEGFVPELDSDQDIKFKYEGRTYYVSVSDTDTSPMYVALFIEYTYDSTYSEAKLVNAQRELNYYKGVKLLCYDSAYGMRGEMYLTDAEQFKYVFYKVLSQLDNMETELEKICRNS